MDLSTTQTVEKLKMYDDTKGGIKIKGMSEAVKNKEDIYEIMERGAQEEGCRHRNECPFFQISLRLSNSNQHESRTRR